LLAAALTMVGTVSSLADAPPQPNLPSVPPASGPQRLDLAGTARRGPLAAFDQSCPGFAAAEADNGGWACEGSPVVSAAKAKNAKTAAATPATHLRFIRHLVGTRRATAAATGAFPFPVVTSASYGCPRTGCYFPWQATTTAPRRPLGALAGVGAANPNPSARRRSQLGHQPLSEPAGRRRRQSHAVATETPGSRRSQRRRRSATGHRPWSAKPPSHDRAPSGAG
jgi:hypothetical protein